MKRYLICVAVVAGTLLPALAGAQPSPGAGEEGSERTFTMKVPLVGSEIDIPERYRLPLLIVAGLVALAYYAPGQVASLRENLSQAKASRMALELRRMQLENLKLEYEIEVLKTKHGLDLAGAEAGQSAEQNEKLETMILEFTKPAARHAPSAGERMRDQLTHLERRKRFMGRRVVAFVIDYLLVAFLAGFLGGLLQMLFPEAAFWGSDTALGYPLAAAYLLYFPVLWAARNATPGLMLFGLRIVRVDGHKLRAKDVAIRYLVFLGLNVVSFLWLAFDQRKQTLHDRLAGTVVVKVRGRPEPADPDVDLELSEQN